MAASAHVNIVLSRLAAAYHRQRLVPFLGAGMSVPTFRLWKDFVLAIEEIAGSPRGRGSQLLLERSHFALRKLRRERQVSLRAAVRKALGATTQSEPTVQTKALAKLRWPLVLTTNYDDLYVKAAAEATERPRERVIQVLGRIPSDCRRVIGSLHEPDDSLLWALHGYLGDVSGPEEFSGALPEDQIVVGHEEYRRVLHHELNFRRAFAEVLRSRSLLFLGCSLGDPDIIGLLDETLAVAGPGLHQHYAVLYANEPGVREKEHLLQHRLGVIPIVLPKYDSLVEEFLDPLETAVRAHRPVQTRWEYAVGSAGRVHRRRANVPEVEIVREPLPEKIPVGAAVLVSGGQAGAPVRRDQYPLWFSDGIDQYLRKVFGILTRPPAPQPCATPGGIVELVTSTAPVIAGFARRPSTGGLRRGDARDARRIFEVTASALDWARRHRISELHAQLLAAGRDASFPPRVALSQMLRGFGSSLQRLGRACPRLVVHLVDDELLAELASGRFDAAECLVHDRVRFWIEVADDDRGDRVDRQQMYVGYDAMLGSVAADLNVAGAGWGFVVVPSPMLEDSAPRVVEEARDSTLESLGVLPGSTVRFLRIPTRAPEALRDRRPSGRAKTAL